MTNSSANLICKSRTTTTRNTITTFSISILALVSIFYICLAYTTQLALTDAARRGADFTTKIPNLDNDTRNLSANDYNYEQFRRSMVLTIQETVDAASEATWFYNPKLVELIEFEMPQTDLAIGPGQAVPRIKGRAGIVLPGKTAEILDSKGRAVEVLTHPVIPPSINGKPLTPSPSFLLAEYPIRVVVRARIRILGLLPFEITAHADRQRQKNILQTELPNPGVVS